jgi:hypothetical protein
MLIDKRNGKKKGIIGITINIYEQYTKPVRSKSLTVHGYTLDEVFAKVKFFFRALEMSDKKKGFKIYIEEES